jgi:hypothetical protein
MVRGAETTICPICGSEAGEFDRTGDAKGYDCVRHGKFKVAGSVSATKQDATRQQWESALVKARARAKSGEWPTITTHDF